MLCRRIIPCLDVAEGRTVKGIKFQNLRDIGDPVALADAYQQQGADELMFLDISASHEGRKTMLEWVHAVADVLMIPFSVGGGVSTIEQVTDLLHAATSQDDPSFGVDDVRARVSARARHRTLVGGGVMAGVVVLVALAVGVGMRSTPPDVTGLGDASAEQQGGSRTFAGVELQVVRLARREVEAPLLEESEWRAPRERQHRVHPPEPIGQPQSSRKAPRWLLGVDDAPPSRFAVASLARL